MTRGWLTSDDPELPEHDQGTAGPVWRHLSRVNRHSGVLGADADTHDESCGKQPLPRLGEGGTNWRGCQARGRDENLTSSSEVVIERIDDEGAARD